MTLEAGQGMGDKPGVAGHAEQVLIQWLLEAAIAVGVGEQLRERAVGHAGCG